MAKLLIQNKKLNYLKIINKMFAILPLDVKIIIASVLDINYYLTHHPYDTLNKKHHRNTDHYLMYNTNNGNCRILINADIGDTPFFKLSFFDEEFSKYASSEIGINNFVNLYKSYATSCWYECSYLFGRFHSFDDKPSQGLGTNQHWHKYGKLHRVGGHNTQGDLPAISSETYFNVKIEHFYKDGIEYVPKRKGAARKNN